MTVSRPRFRNANLLLLLLIVLPTAPLSRSSIAADKTGVVFANSIRPILKKYCHDCHSGALTEADIDLGAFNSLENVRQQPDVWLKVRGMLDSQQMPPKDAPQATETEFKRLQEWVRLFLAEQARSSDGDPGPVTLRRLNNAEYTYTVRDLTDVDSLDPAKEFPVDGAAGEGFTNAGSGQSMSPALVRKYLDAAKRIAAHVVLLPDGLRFSKHTSRRDQTDELLAQIQAFYRRFSEDGGGVAVDLQGIKFDTNQGGRLPLKKYLQATLDERNAINSGQKTVATIAHERSLSVRYLEKLWKTLTSNVRNERSILIEPIREKWRAATPADGAELATEIEMAQKSLWKFNSIGHFGQEGTPKQWMQAISQIETAKEFRLPLPRKSPHAESVIYLTATELADGNVDDFVVWKRPRIEFPIEKPGESQPPVLLRDVATVTRKIRETFEYESARTKSYLAAIAESGSSKMSPDDLATKHKLNTQLLRRWAKLVDVNEHAEPVISNLLTNKLTAVHGHEAINGWGLQQTPSVLTNRSNQPVSFLTLTVPARGVTVHPSPKQEAVVSWRSPIAGQLRIAGMVADADNKCGNGAAWRLERHSTSGKSVMAHGTINNGGKQRLSLDDEVKIAPGDLISLAIAARDGNHVCDTTRIELKLVETKSPNRVWDLAADVVDNVERNNPLGDSYGHESIWHFCSFEPASLVDSMIVPGSTLDRWRAAVIEKAPAERIGKLAAAVQAVLATEDASTLGEPDIQQRRQLRDWVGPLGWLAVGRAATSRIAPNRPQQSDNEQPPFGVEPTRFGRHPHGGRLDPADICVRAPIVMAVRLPFEMATGGVFVTSGTLYDSANNQGSVQIDVLDRKPERLVASAAAPILVAPNSHARNRIEASMRRFRELFPIALCYARIVPVDEVVTMTLFHREDDHLKRLMLNDREIAELDRMWDELIFVSQEPIALTIAFEQLAEFATQDRPDLVKAFEPLKKPINDRAKAFRKMLIEREPVHLDAVRRFAHRAWRRPLAESEIEDLYQFYSQLRSDEIPHEQAIRLTLSRVLTSPSFLYKLERPAAGMHPTRVSDIELATRLSYFLCSSLPDPELRHAAESGRLSDEKNLLAQTHRLLAAPTSRRLAIHFACQWLHLRNFGQNNDKNEDLYPDFASLRGDMYEETIRFFEEMFRNNGSMLDLLDADFTFVNGRLAEHYGIPNVDGTSWRRIDRIKRYGRGGILGMATFLASQSGASRTSPILRGNWVYETLLGERLPRPPAGVPRLPDELPGDLTARQLIERHSSVAECAKCHEKIDPFGFALEQYDAIGRLRRQSVDTQAKLPDRATMDDLGGLRKYLLTQRREHVVRQFCRKLLGYALGREVQLSDEPLLDRMQGKLAANDFRFHVAVELVVKSRQFQSIRPSK